MELKRLIEIMREYDADYLINPDDFAFCDNLYLLKSHYNIIGFVFADCLQDALDEAVDAGKMGYFEVDPEEWEDHELSYLGNNGKPHIIDDLFAEEIT